MSIYTYVVDHKGATPVVSAAMHVNGGELVAVMFADALKRIDELEERLREIGDFAHEHSSGPVVPDALWEVRSMAYDA